MYEKESLYPRRPPETIAGSVQKLENQEVYRLSESERVEFIAYENRLGDELYEIYKVPVVTTDFYTGYFLTDHGRKDFTEVTGVKLLGNSPQSVTEEITRSIGKMSTTDITEIKELGNRSMQYFCNDSVERFQQQLQRGETFSLDAGVTERVHYVLNPDETEKKLRDLRAFKQRIKNELTQLPGENDSIKKDFLILYLQRVNELIARTQMAIAADKRFTQSPPKQSDRNTARYDRFVFGASDSPDVSGIYSALTKELLDFADYIDAERYQNDSMREERIRQRGIDPEKLFAETVDSEEVVRMVEFVLEQYGVKSMEDSKYYTVNRPGPASDNKWQVVVTDGGGMFVDGVQKVIKIPCRKISIAKAVSVACAHEVEGHVLQSENRKHLPLKLFGDIRGDRSELYAEAGAMYNQDKISRELFGYRQLPASNYVRALAVRSTGGDFAQCVETFYKNAVQSIDKQESTNAVSATSARAERDRLMRLAVNRTLRLFRGARSLSGGEPTSSKDLVYLEQLRVMKELEKFGADKYAYVSGVNIDSARILKKWGLLDEDKIMRPEFYSREVWEQVKSRFIL